MKYRNLIQEIINEGVKKEIKKRKNLFEEKLNTNSINNQIKSFKENVLNFHRVSITFLEIFHNHVNISLKNKNIFIKIKEIGDNLNNIVSSPISNLIMSLYSYMKDKIESNNFNKLNDKEVDVLNELKNAFDNYNSFFKYELDPIIKNINNDELNKSYNNYKGYFNIIENFFYHIDEEFKSLGIENEKSNNKFQNDDPLQEQKLIKKKRSL